MANADISADDGERRHSPPFFGRYQQRADAIDRHGHDPLCLLAEPCDEEGATHALVGCGVLLFCIHCNQWCICDRLAKAEERARADEREKAAQRVEARKPSMADWHIFMFRSRRARRYYVNGWLWGQRDALRAIAAARGEA